MKKRSIDEIIFFLFGLTSVLCIALICFFIFAKGIPTISKIGVSDFLLGIKWKPKSDVFGIFPMILASIIVAVGSAIIGVPIGILCATYMAMFTKGKFYTFLQSIVDLLAGIPSIVYGFFGLVVLVPIFREILPGNGKHIFTASFLLGLMILPQIISVSENAISSVKKTYYNAAVAQGISHERVVFSVVLPAAKSGIMSSIILGIGRSIGETMAVIMVIGNQPILPKNLFKGARTLTGNIVIEMGYATGMHRDALLATAMVLFIIVLLINVIYQLAVGGERSNV